MREVVSDAALHAARPHREIVRQFKVSSIEGPSVEYSFWHGLIRDVAYGQIPRRRRARRSTSRRREWIESTRRRASLGVRPSSSSTTTSEALELSRSAGADRRRHGARGPRPVSALGASPVIGRWSSTWREPPSASARALSARRRRRTIPMRAEVLARMAESASFDAGRYRGGPANATSRRSPCSGHGRRPTLGGDVPGSAGDRALGSRVTRPAAERGWPRR